MRLFQLNVSSNWGSHGKITETIGNLILKNGGESLIAYGRHKNLSSSEQLRVGSDIDIKIHGISTRFLDRHGLESKKATKQLIKQVEKFSPDIIHLHNIHGYYLNYPILFNWLKEIKKPVVWTLHDCWPWTGHCAYYTFHKCDKWKTGCHNCPGLDSYPKSFHDGSRRNYVIKREAFIGVENLVLVPVSNWLANDLKESFLKDYPAQVIHNGINISVFKPSYNKTIISKLGLDDKKIILGVASVWEKRKGLEEFIKLRKLLSDKYAIVLVGLSKKQIKSLPEGIIGITRTNNQQELVQLYSIADVFANPTLEDNFPTTNLEALACGTPVITYDTGGSPEAIDTNTGIVVPYQNIIALGKAIEDIIAIESPISNDCRLRAELLFNQNDAFQKYITLYNSLL